MGLIGFIGFIRFIALTGLIGFIGFRVQGLGFRDLGFGPKPQTLNPKVLGVLVLRV